jgi:thiol-disulfide isomerase/thioredoxin
MAHDDQGTRDPWVNDRLATLLTPERADEWQPDANASLSVARARETMRRARRIRLAAGGVVAAAVLVSVPGTRALGAKCVGACVAVTTRAAQRWSGGEPDAARPPVTGALVGDIAPDVVGLDAHGAPVHLSGLRGRVVVLNFWATWCGPCLAEIPVLNDLGQRYGSQVEVIGVSLDEDGWTAIDTFRTDHPMNYPLALANDDVLASFGGVDQLPATFVIDRTGRIVIKRVGLLTESALPLPIDEVLGR